MYSEENVRKGTSLLCNEFCISCLQYIFWKSLQNDTCEDKKFIG